MLPETIPEDIWREIISYLSFLGKKKASRTCKHLRDICLPFIFKSISCKFDTDSLQLPWFGSLKERALVMKRMSLNPKLAACIQRCFFDASLDRKRLGRDRFTEDDYQHWMSMAIYSLSKFANLRAFHLVLNRRMDSFILAQLRLVEDLTVECGEGDVDFHLMILNDFLLSKPRRKLSVIISSAEEESYYDSTISRPKYIPSDRLEEISLESDCITRRILSSFRQGEPLHHLVTLTIDLRYSDIHILSKFLQLCPQLLSLAIETFSKEDWDQVLPLPQLPASGAPLLRQYYGSDSLGLSIIPGRPLQSVVLIEDDLNDLDDSSDIRRDLEALLKGTCPLRFLAPSAIPCDPEIISELARSFPALQTLRLIVFEDHIADQPDYEQDVHQGQTPDIDLGEDGQPKYGPSTYKGLLYRIALGQISLPPGMVSLQITRDGDEPALHLDITKRIVVLMRKQFPLLRRLKIGDDASRVWVRRETDWHAYPKDRWMDDWHDHDTVW